LIRRPSSSDWLRAAVLCLAVWAVASCDRANPVGPATGASEVGLPGNVYEVRTLGSWRDGDRAGTFRVVTLRGGFDHVRTIIVVQWMQQGIGEEAPEVVAERRVELLDDLGPIAVVAVREVAPSDGLHLRVRTKNQVSGEEGEVEVLAHAPDRLTATYVLVTE